MNHSRGASMGRQKVVPIPLPTSGMRTTDPIRRLRAVSRAMTIATSVAMVGACLTVVTVWLLPVLTGATIVPGAPRPGTIFTSPSGRLLALPVILILLGLLLYSLDQARRLFAEFAAGEILTARAAQRLKRIAYAVIAGATLRPLTRAVLVMALAIDAPPDSVRQHSIRWAISLRNAMDDLAFLLAGLLLLAIAWALAEAARIAADHRQFV